MKPKFENLQKDLQEFAERYFEEDCPKIEWKERLKGNGLADIEKNKIYLNPNILLKQGFGADIYHEVYLPENNIHPKGNEKYFAVLLHEIGHFKLIEDFQLPPKWEELKEEFKEDFCSRQESKGEAELERDFRAFASNCSYFDKKEGEKEVGRQSHIKDVFFWTLKGYPLKEIEVVDWALKEFKKRRKEINQILKRYG